MPHIDSIKSPIADSAIAEPLALNRLFVFFATRKGTLANLSPSQEANTGKTSAKEEEGGGFWDGQRRCPKSMS